MKTGPCLFALATMLTFASTAQAQSVVDPDTSTVAPIVPGAIIGKGGTIIMVGTAVIGLYGPLSVPPVG